MFLSEFRDTIQGIWIIVATVSRDHFYDYISSSFGSNPYLEYVLEDNWTNETRIDPFYPCIKYKIPADQELDGTDHVTVAETMGSNGMYVDSKDMHFSLYFTCENDQKAFYKLIKDCLR